MIYWSTMPCLSCPKLILLLLLIRSPYLARASKSSYGIDDNLSEHILISVTERLEYKKLLWMERHKKTSYLTLERNFIESLLEKRLIIRNKDDIYGLVQERRNSIANALELCLSRTNSWIYTIHSWPDSYKCLQCDFIIPYCIKQEYALNHWKQNGSADNIHPCMMQNDNGENRLHIRYPLHRICLAIISWVQQLWADLDNDDNELVWYATRPGPLFTNTDQLQTQHGQVISCLVKYEMKLIILSQTSVVEVWECINNFIPQFIMDVFTYPCWDCSWTILLQKTDQCDKRLILYFIVTQNKKL